MGRLVGGGGRVGWEGHLPNTAEQRTEDSEQEGDLHRGPFWENLSGAVISLTLNI